MGKKKRRKTAQWYMVRYSKGEVVRMLGGVKAFTCSMIRNTWETSR